MSDPFEHKFDNPFRFASSRDDEGLPVKPLKGKHSDFPRLRVGERIGFNVPMRMAFHFHHVSVDAFGFGVERREHKVVVIEAGEQVEFESSQAGNHIHFTPETNARVMDDPEAPV